MSSELQPPPGDKFASFTTNSLDPTNMVLSAIPLDGHVVIQQSTGSRIIASANTSSGNSNTITSNNYAQVSSNIITSTHPMTKTTMLTGNGSATIHSPSKYVFLQHNGNGQYTTNEAFITANASQSNNVGNIVLLATEQMNTVHTEQVVSAGKNGNTRVETSAAHDEELTSLTWLHDKNLIKGIVACSNDTSKSGSPGHTGMGPLSPTSDFLEESCVSEDNSSLANSNVDIGNSGQNSSSDYFSSSHHQQPQYINNNTINKNRNHIVSPIHTNFASTQEHISENLPTTTIHVGPSGTTTVVEYKANTNYTAATRHFSNNNTSSNHVPSSPQRNSKPSGGVVVSNVCSSQQSSPTASSGIITSTPTHHPHKKYLREQMNGLHHTGINRASNATTLTPKSVQYSNHNASLSLSSSPPSSYNTSYAIQNQPQVIKTVSPEPPKEYPLNIIKSPASYSTNSYESDSLKDYEMSTNNGTPLSSPSNLNGRQQQQKSSTLPKQKHPTNVPYDPMVHTHNKPPYSFSSLIFMAIEDSPEKALPVKEIYAWIVMHFPYFKTAPTGWKNSVRHNLSLNKSFVKVEKAPNMGKGSLWRVEQLQRPNLIQALTRSPFFPCSAVDKISQKSPPSSPHGSDSAPSTPVKSRLDSKLFPKLSKMIKEIVSNGGMLESAESNGNSLSNAIGHYESIEHLARDCGADSIDDVNAATAMLALKHGPKVFTETFHNGAPVITSSPSEDHTYSAGGAGSVNGTGASSSGVNGSATASTISITKSNVNSKLKISDNQSYCASSDAAYESSEDGHNVVTPQELEEQQRHRDGVDALLSLSSMFDISPIKRSPSTTVEQEHISSYMSNIPHLHGKGSLAISNGKNSATILDECYNTPNYYGQLISPSQPKKIKPIRSLRAKMKRKATWIR